jgi:MFS family permease
METSELASKGAAKPGLPTDSENTEIIETDIPSRLDALPWGRFHTLVIVALGVTWILDGLEVTLAGAVASALKLPAALGLSNEQVGFSGSAYLGGAVIGALYFGWLTDRMGRKKLFFLTLGVYLLATAATAFSWNFWSFALCRVFVGAGIGGEYAAVNSTIQELIPARVRGWTDLVVNGSFWVGAALGAAGSLFLLDAGLIDPAYGWRAAFLMGALLGLFIFFLRILIPESPRWLIMHGRKEEAEAAMRSIEAHFGRENPAAHSGLKTIKLRARLHTPMGDIFKTLFETYPRRTLVGLCLMASQAFLYNAVFFTYALILTDFYGVAPGSIGWHLLALAAGNFLGPLLLGHFFDSLGRKIMISATYAVSGLLLALVGWLFYRDLFSAETQTAGWMVLFFFASPAASSAYLTVSETFPIEMRALAIAIFYAVGTAIGGFIGPWLFGMLIGGGMRSGVFVGYLLGASLMIGAALVEWIWGLDAERKSLETVARPLTAAE